MVLRHETSCHCGPQPGPTTRSALYDDVRRDSTRARSEDYNSASSQFFIIQKNSTYSDGAYAAFGQVTSGMDIVDQICADAEPIDGNGLIAADAQAVITSITIRT